jgi:hypothetical protein
VVWRILENYAMYGLVPRGFYLNWKFNLVMTTQVSKFLFLLLSEYMYIKARCHYQSFLCQRKLWQSFWWNFDSDNSQRNLWSKNLTNFDGIELHPIFLQTLMDFDGYQPIRILFWNDEMMFTKQKHMIMWITKQNRVVPYTGWCYV